VIFPRIHICHSLSLPRGGNPNKYLSHVETGTRNMNETQPRACSLRVQKASYARRRYYARSSETRLNGNGNLPDIYQPGHAGEKPSFSLYPSFFSKRSEVRSDRDPRVTRLPGDATRKGRHTERDRERGSFRLNSTGILQRVRCTLATGKHPDRP